MSNKKVFISYKSQEVDKALKIRNLLMENGIESWMAPYSIPGGADYAEKISKAIEKCDAFILILTEAAQTSGWIRKELDQAIALNKTIMPFMIEKCELVNPFTFYLTNVQRYNAWADFDLEFQRLVRDIYSLDEENPSGIFDDPKPIRVKTGKSMFGKLDEHLKKHKPLVTLLHTLVFLMCALPIFMTWSDCLPGVWLLLAIAVGVYYPGFLWRNYKPTTILGITLICNFICIAEVLFVGSFSVGANADWMLVWLVSYLLIVAMGITSYVKWYKMKLISLFMAAICAIAQFFVVIAVGVIVNVLIFSILSNIKTDSNS